MPDTKSAGSWTCTIVVLLLLSACGGPSVPGPPVQSVLRAYSHVAERLYDRSLDSAREMQVAIDDFVVDPRQSTLDRARRTWIEARRDYGLTEALRFASGPIDGPGGPEPLINAWPLDESYIDGVQGAQSAGFLQDPDRLPTIDEASLIGLNERGGEENVATGWHAIEFMLWGQDLRADGPGARPLTDFVAAPYAERRRRFLQVTTNLLVGHLEWLAAQWQEEPGSYRSELVVSGGEDDLRRIFSGLVEMVRGEIAGERLVVPYETRSQEDEQSCFSDTTTNDLQANIDGVDLVLRGGVEGAGPSLLDLLAGRGADVASVSRSLEAARSAMAAIPAPFDSHLGPELSDSAPGRVAIATAIERLEDLAEILESAATAALGSLPAPPQ